MTITPFACQIDYRSAVTLMLTEMIDWPPRELGGPVSGLIPSQQFSDTSVRKRMIGKEGERESQTTPQPHMLLPVCPPVLASKIFWWATKGRMTPGKRGSSSILFKIWTVFLMPKLGGGFWLKCLTMKEKDRESAGSTLRLRPSVGWIWT